MTELIRSGCDWLKLHIFFRFVIKIFNTKKSDDLPWPILHIILSTKDHQHISTTIIEHPCPIFYHPNSSVLMYELIFKVKNIWIIRCYFHVCVTSTKIKDLEKWIYKKNVFNQMKEVTKKKCLKYTKFQTNKKSRRIIVRSFISFIKQTQIVQNIYINGIVFFL